MHYTSKFLKTLNAYPLANSFLRISPIDIQHQILKHCNYQTFVHSAWLQRKFSTYVEYLSSLLWMQLKGQSHDVKLVWFLARKGYCV